MDEIGVIGLDPTNQAMLDAVAGREDVIFRELLTYREAVNPPSGEIAFDSLVDTARRRIAENGYDLSGIIGWWDFPTTGLAPVLQGTLGLPGADLPAVAACEHKYWSRLRQAEILPGLVPRVAAVDPFATDPLAAINLEFPFWIKPVKAHSSYLGFRISKAQDFRAALPRIREGIGLFGKPFNEFLARIDLPDEVARIDGYHCIAEEIISQGQQCTLEGYVHKGRTVVYGVVDSIRGGRNRSSFSRYQYPSQLPQHVAARMCEAAATYLAHIGYDDAPFNMEFYWSKSDNEIRLLEVNTRISKSHSPLFMMVDGQPHQKVAIDLALGRAPDFPAREGRYPMAGKFMLRVFEDARVESVPSARDLERFHAEFPGSYVNIHVQPGDCLAHLPYQDSYSFQLADIFLGGESQAELRAKYDRALELLPFRTGTLDRVA